MRDCPKKKACNTMFKENGEKQLEVPPIEAVDTGCFHFFNALNAKQLPAKVQDKSLMHVEATINSKRAQATTRKMSFTDTSLLTLCKKCQYLCTYAPFSAFDK